MKKEQKKLPPFQLKAEKIVNKYADYKKLKNFYNEISHIFKTFAAALLKGGIQSVNYLSKITYLTLQNASKKWQRQARNWHIN